jgi:hypothetical protein
MAAIGERGQFEMLSYEPSRAHRFGDNAGQLQPVVRGGPT